RVELVESHGRRVLVDAPAAQLGGDPPAGEPSFGVPGAHDGLRVRRVVGQADVAEPVQDLLRDVLGVAFARQRLLELAAGLLRGRQDPQDDLASLLDGLVPADLAGLEALGHGAPGRPVGTPAPAPAASAGCSRTSRSAPVPGSGTTPTLPHAGTVRWITVLHVRTAPSRRPPPPWPRSSPRRSWWPSSARRGPWWPWPSRSSAWTSSPRRPCRRQAPRRSPGQQGRPPARPPSGRRP